MIPKQQRQVAVGEGEAGVGAVVMGSPSTGLIERVACRVGPDGACLSVGPAVRSCASPPIIHRETPLRSAPRADLIDGRGCMPSGNLFGGPRVGGKKTKRTGMMGPAH